MVASLGFLSLGAALALGCGDDGGGADDTTTETSTGDPGSTSSPPPTSTTQTPGTGDTADTVDTTTTGTPSDGTMTGDDTGTDDGGSSSGTDTAGLDCTAIPAGPFMAQMALMPFAGSEDLAFDGAGGLAGKDGGEVRVVDVDGVELAAYTDMGPAYGLRYRANGNILVAHFQSGVIAAIDPGTGNSTNLLTGVNGVNGLYPDFDDQVWFTNGGSVGRINADDSTDPIVSGADASGANGVVYDADRELLFWTNYSAGTIRAMSITPTGDPGPTALVASIPGTALDGLVFDACGNLYVVHQQGNEIYRVFLDDSGAPVGDPEMILTGPTAQNIANAQFGRGEGWDEMSLYAAGNPGTVYRIEVGVPGAPIP